MEKIIDFEAKKQMKFVKQINNDTDEIAEMVIQTCFENGQKEYELAAELLAGIKVSGKAESACRQKRRAECGIPIRKQNIISGFAVRANIFGGSGMLSPQKKSAFLRSF